MGKQEGSIAARVAGHRAALTNPRRKRFWLLVAFLAYTLLGFYAAPPLVQRLFTGTFAQAGREASLAHVRVHPWRLRLVAQGASVKDPDGVEVLAFREAVADFQLVSLFHWAWTFREARLDGLQLTEERFGGFDTRLLRFAQAMAGEPQPGSEEPPGEPPRLIIRQLALRDARIALTDHQANGFHTVIGPIDIEVHDLRTLPDHRGQQAVSIVTAYGDRIEWRGDLRLLPLSSSGRLTLVGNTLHDTLDYLDHFQPFGLRLSDIDVALDYRLDEQADGVVFRVDSLELAVEGLKARMDDAEADIAGLDQLRISGASFQWPENRARMSEVALGGLALDAVLLADGSLNLDAMLPAESAETAAGDAPPLDLRIERLVLAGGRVDVRDEGVAPPVRLVVLDPQLSLTGIDLDDGTRMPASAGWTLESGGQLAFEGEAVAFPVAELAGRLRLADLALPVVEPYLQQFARVLLKDGRLGLDAEIAWRADTAPRLSGVLDLDALELHDALKDERLAAWEKLHIDALEADLAANRVAASTLEFRKPYGRLHIAEDLSTNVGDLLVEPPPGEAAEESPPLGIAIAGIAIRDGALDFSDFSLPLPFSSEIRKLKGEVGPLATDSDEPAPVQLEGQVNRFGMATIQGALDAWDITSRADIAMQFRNLEMERLTPYTVQFAGYAIETGRMDLELQYLLADRKLQGDNNIVIRELDLGEKVEHPDAGSLPLRLAVALLTDTNGVIDIDLPVSGDLDDPSFKISGLVWRALGNLITKAVTAPFRLLGALVGFESEDFGRLAFAAGEAALSPPDREQMVKLAQAMAQRPELALKVNGVVAADADRAALQAQALDAQLEAARTALPATADRDRRALEALAAQQLPGLDLAALLARHSPQPATEGEAPLPDVPAYLAELRQQLLDAQAVSEADLAALAQARAQAVLAALTEAQPDAVPRTVPGETQQVEPDDSGRVPLELAVEAD